MATKHVNKRNICLTVFMSIFLAIFIYTFFSYYYSGPQNFILRDKGEIDKLPVKSTCSSAKFRGFGQNVVSYSFYGSSNSTYFKGIPKNAELVARMYPGWIMRLYHNIDPTDHESQSQLKQIMSEHPNLDECYVGNISQDDFPGIEKKFGMIWRFLVMGDESVDKFMVRDLDSVPIQREVDAVNEWLNSSYTFHLMRDNIVHTAYILGGMWGGKNKNMKQMKEVIMKLVGASKSHQKSSDQSLLSQYVWPLAKEDSMAHDSFLCQTYPNTRPWPTSRVNMTFVGAPPNNYIDINKKCPVKCRPVNHKDWEYC